MVGLRARIEAVERELRVRMDGAERCKNLCTSAGLLGFYSAQKTTYREAADLIAAALKEEEASDGK